MATLIKSAEWACSYWLGRSGLEFLSWFAVEHNAMHLGEAGVVRGAVEGLTR